MPAEQKAEKTLYQRLGGYDAIAAVIDDLFRALKSDPRFGRFGTGRSLDSRRRAQQLLVEQMCELAGGPCFYTGRDMKTAHAGLGITESEWEVNTAYTAAALDRNGIGEAEKAEFLAIFSRFKDDIVEEKSPNNFP